MLNRFSASEHLHNLGPEEQNLSAVVDNKQSEKRAAGGTGDTTAANKSEVQAERPKPSIENDYHDDDRGQDVAPLGARGSGGVPVYRSQRDCTDHGLQHCTCGADRGIE